MALPKIDVPRYPVTIPSTGEEFIMRPYLVKEEKVLLLAMESQDPKQIALAIRNLINNYMFNGSKQNFGRLALNFLLQLLVIYFTIYVLQK